MRRLAIATLASCASAPLTAPSTAPTNLSEMKITDGSFAAGHTAQHETVDIPFELDPDGSSGTAIVLAYLRVAESSGARYASDLAIELQFLYHGEPMDCVTKIALEDPAAPAPPVEPAPPTDEPGEYTTSVKPWRPGEVTMWVTDRELACAKQGNQVVVDAPRYESRFDVEVARPLEPGEMPVEKKAMIVWTDECHLESKYREVHRFAHFVATKFTPPDWTWIGKTYAEARLVEQAPECHRFQRTPGAPLVHTMHGTLHYTGSPGREKFPRALVFGVAADPAHLAPRPR
jgi:hypothetical protein